MDIREYLQKEQKGFYNIIINSLTVGRRIRLYDAINEWHERELKLLTTPDVDLLVCENCSKEVLEPIPLGHMCPYCACDM